MALLLTVISGIFFLLGIYIYNKSKEKDKLIKTSVACATIIIVNLVVFELIPDVVKNNSWWIYLFVILGGAILVAIHKLIPHHHHEHKDHCEKTHEHEEQIIHISYVTLIAMLLHNVLHGLSLYNMGITDMKSGILMTIAISLHNIPFGIQVAPLLKENKKIFSIFLLVTSNLMGGLLGMVFGEINISFISIVNALTLGMATYLLLFELLKEVIGSIKKKETIYGIIIGVLIILIIRII